MESVRLGAPDTRVIPSFFFCEALVVARKRICMIEERSLTSYLIIWKTTKIIKGGNIMSKSNSFKKSRKLALGIAVAMGGQLCSCGIC